MRRRAGKTGVRKLTKLGGKSIGVTLPIELVRSLGWPIRQAQGEKEKQKVACPERSRRVVKRIPGGLSIRDWRKH